MYNNFEYEILNLKNEKKYNELRNFLLDFDLNLDLVDYTIVVKNENKIIATISKYFNLMKCIAISSEFEGIGLSNSLITQMMLKIKDDGYESCFLITKSQNYQKFINSGLYQIYRNDKIVFFSDNLTSFNDYLSYLDNQDQSGSSAIVMNANPFTKGHEYLVEQASLKSKNVYVIPVKDDSSFFTYKERLEMIKKGIAKFNNVKVIEGSDFLISKATFPSYFLNEKDEIVYEQAKLDTGLFYEIYCKHLNINQRFVGDEPFSRTTNIYNQVMNEVLNPKGIKIDIISRKQLNNAPISASTVRKAILNNDSDVIMNMCPPQEFDFLTSEEIHLRAKENINKIIKNN